VKVVNARRGGPATDRRIGSYFSTMKAKDFMKPLLSSGFSHGGPAIVAIRLDQVRVPSALFWVAARHA